MMMKRKEFHFSDESSDEKLIIHPPQMSFWVCSAVSPYLIDEQSETKEMKLLASVYILLVTLRYGWCFRNASQLLKMKVMDL